MHEDTLEVYKILSSAYMDENRRYWTRYSIFTGFQMAGIYAIAKTDTNMPNGISILLLIFSISSIIIFIRGIFTLRAISKTMIELEREMAEEIKIYSKYMKNDPIKIQWINPAASVIVSLSILFYSFFLIFK